MVKTITKAFNQSAYQMVPIEAGHLLSACSLLSAEFGAVLEGFLFSTYAGVYKSMLFWPHPLIKSYVKPPTEQAPVLLLPSTKCHKRPSLITSFYCISHINGYGHRIRGL